MKGAVTIAFDDAYLQTYKYAIAHLDSVGIKSTIAVPSLYIGRRFEKRKIIGYKELRNLIKSGHEIASHSYSHKNLLKLHQKNRAAVLSEIAKSKSVLEKVAGYKVESFVFPYIHKNYSERLIKLVSSYYNSSRITTCNLYFNKPPIKNFYKLVGFAVVRNLSIKYLNRCVSYAMKNGLYLIEVFHLVGIRNTLSASRLKPYRFFFHIKDFKRHIQYILSSGIEVVTQKDAIKNLGCRL